MRSDSEIGRALHALRSAVLGRLVLAKALRLHRLLGKANFNPNQPRVPRGDPRGGQWTRDGNASGAKPLDPPPSGPPILLGHPEDPLEIPRDRPPTEKVRNAIIKRLARWALRQGLRKAPLVGDAIWVYEFAERIAAFLEPPKALEELQRDAERWRLGTEKHHIVEEDAARKEAFLEEWIQAPENLVRISRIKHEDITAWFMTKNEKYGGLSPREYLRSKPWSEGRRVGLEAMIEAGVLKP